MRLEQQITGLDGRCSPPPLWTSNIHEGSHQAPPPSSQSLVDAGILGNLELIASDPAKATSKLLSAPIVAFDHFVQQQNTKLKPQMHESISSIQDIAMNRNIGNKHPLEESGEMAAGAAMAAIRTTDQTYKRMTPYAAMKDIADSVQAAKAAKNYYAEKGQSQDWQSVAADAKQVLDSMAKWINDYSHRPAAERGSVIGTAAMGAFFCTRSGAALTEGELANRLGRETKDMANISEKELASLGIKRIEEMNGRLPTGWRNAGKVVHFEGSLGEKYPQGVRFMENGFPDFSPYVYKLPNGKPVEVKVLCTGTRTLDEALANKASGLDKTPRDYIWHRQDTRTMQLIPQDLHSALRHGGGAMKSSLKYES